MTLRQLTLEFFVIRDEAASSSQIIGTLRRYLSRPHTSTEDRLCRGVAAAYAREDIGRSSL